MTLCCFFSPNRHVGGGEEEEEDREEIHRRPLQIRQAIDGRRLALSSYTTSPWCLLSGRRGVDTDSVVGDDGGGKGSRR